MNKRKEVMDMIWGSIHNGWSVETLADKIVKFFKQGKCRDCKCNDGVEVSLNNKKIVVCDKLNYAMESNFGCINFERRENNGNE